MGPLPLPNPFGDGAIGGGSSSSDSSGSSSGSSPGGIFLSNNPNSQEFTTYCQNVLNYMSTCIRGPDVATYCSTGGLYCVDSSGLYDLNNVQVQCNATTVTLCPERYYCPDPYTQIACPIGHYCREGIILNLYDYPISLLICSYTVYHSFPLTLSLYNSYVIVQSIIKFLLYLLDHVKKLTHL